MQLKALVNCLHTSKEIIEKKISNFIHTSYADNCFELHFDFQFWKTLISVLTDQNSTPRTLSFLQCFFCKILLKYAHQNDIFQFRQILHKKFHNFTMNINQNCHFCFKNKP